MNDLTKTLVTIAAAAGLAAAAWTVSPRPMSDAQFSDQGEVFFPSFADPLAARSLEMVSFDEQTAAYKPFKVQFDGQRWVIPSHSNYPADAEQNMAKAASAFIGLKKEQVVSDHASDHGAMGVLAPDDDKAPMQGRGTRVTLRDGSGAVLSDLILGKPVEKAVAQGKVFARVPGKNRVYAVSLPQAVTPKFSDWVQTDLLRLGGASVESIKVDRYSVDERSGSKSTEETLVLRRAPAAAPPASPDAPPPVSWTFTAEPGGGPGAAETVNEERVLETVGALQGLKIVGVRPKPEKLADFFSGKTREIALTNVDVMNLQSRGFFVTQTGQFLANEGEVTASTNDGVVYTLYFGEVLFGQGEALTAGVDQSAPAEPGPDASASEEGKDPVGQETRYVFVTAAFDPTLLPPAPVAPTPPAAPSEPPPAPAPAAEGEAPDAPAPAPKPEDDPAYKAALQQYATQLAQHNASREAGEKRAEALRSTFAKWYYVIDAESYRKLRPTRTDLVKAPGPAAPADGAAAPPGIPGLSPSTPAPEPVEAEPVPVEAAPGTP